MDEVATRAGVGIGTVYRHFPNKEAVVEALIAEHFDALAGDAAAALERPDVGAAFADWVRSAAERQSADRGLAEIMSTRPFLLHERALGRADLGAVVSQLVERAQVEGAVRADLRPEDIPVLMCGLASAARFSGRDAPESRRRYLEVLLDGMRASAR
jgi:AcrR family transcriptional regulator